jgi:hypothetical protein
LKGMTFGEDEHPPRLAEFYRRAKAGNTTADHQKIGCRRGRRSIRTHGYFRFGLGDCVVND